MIPRLVCAVFAFIPMSSAAAVVLTVDVSDPSMVTITATGANSEIDITGNRFNGISLVGFLAVPATGANISAISNGLLVDVSQNSLDIQFIGINGGFLNLFGPNGTIEFLTTAPAFSGQGIFNLSQQAVGALPSFGATGSVALGDSTPFNNVIGTYFVIPEPASATLLGLGALLVARRRRLR